MTPPPAPAPRPTSSRRTGAIPGTRRPPGPDPARLAGLLARTWLEVRAGRRPLSQLAPLVAPAVRRRLVRQVPRRAWAGRHAAVRVIRVVTSWPSPGACEATVLVEQDGRTTAIALRLERHRGAWRVVELAAPEAGLAPLPTSSRTGTARPRDAFDEAFEEAGEELPAHLR